MQSRISGAFFLLRPKVAGAVHTRDFQSACEHVKFNDPRPAVAATPGSTEPLDATCSCSSERTYVTQKELEALVTAGESDQVEFKRSTGQRTEGARAVCGMLNGRGGYVVFGVSDDAEIRGQDVSANTLEQLVAELRKIEPRTVLQVERVSLDNGREVLVVPVVALGDGPYTHDGRAYIREGPTTGAMPQDMYQRVLLERMHPQRRWELQPAAGFTVADLDAGEISRTIDEAVRRHRLDDPGTRDPVDLLEGLGLIFDGRPLNAAIVLFARSERLLPYYPQCLLRLARFRGVDKSEFLDNRQEIGNAFELLQRAQRFLRDHLPVAGRVVPDLFERIDDPLYPPVALREALANALCHRDYAAPGGSVSIAIFDDRLEIASTGQLPFGLSPEDLLRPHGSRPWNPLIAQTFFRRGIIDQWGRGTLKIVQLTEEAGLVAPEFEERGGEVVVRFSPIKYVPPSRASHEVTALQQRILATLAEHGPMPSTRIREILGEDIPEKTMLNNLGTLQHLRLVSKSGRTRDTRWSLVGLE